MCLEGGGGCEESRKNQESRSREQKAVNARIYEVNSRQETLYFKHRGAA